MLVISIHAPAKGATKYRLINQVCIKNFNPRSREGSDCRFRLCNRICTISIHAPAKGATSGLRLKHCIMCDFNPRSREGSDK